MSRYNACPSDCWQIVYIFLPLVGITEDDRNILENIMNRIQDKYISPFTDFGFKKLFGSEPNKDILIDFLNELLKKDEGKITNISFLDKEKLGRREDDRRAIFDIYCETEKGEKIIVEMQKAKQQFFKDRSVYYSTFPIQEQALKGTWNFKLKAVYTIGILDFVFDENKNDKKVYHHEIQLFNKTTQKVFFDKLTYIYLEMPNFKKKIVELDSHLDKWLYILKNLNNLTEIPENLKEDVFNKLFDEAKIASYSDNEYAEYEESLKIYRDLINVTDTAFDDGKKEGKIEGKNLGKEERSLEVAINMLVEKLDINIISKVTGFAIEEIENLKKKM